jgi:hypothetical protein
MTHAMRDAPKTFGAFLFGHGLTPMRQGWSGGGLNFRRGCLLISFLCSCISFLSVFHPCPSLATSPGIFLLLPTVLGADLRLHGLSVIAMRQETLYKTRLRQTARFRWGRQIHDE